MASQLAEIATADNDVRYVKEDLKHFDFCGVAHESRYEWLLHNWDIKNKTVLDFGCGSGYGASMLSQVAKQVVGIDYSEKAVEFAQKTYKASNLHFEAMNACSPEIVSKLKKYSFDLIVSFDVIEHIEHYFDYLKNVHALMTDDSVLILGCPNRLQTLKWNHLWNPFHFQEFSPYQLRKILSLYFKNVKIGSQDFKSSEKRELARIQNYGAPKKYKEIIKFLLPNFLIQKLKRIRSNYASKNGSFFEYSDIDIQIEPPHSILQNAFGLISISKLKRDDIP